MDKAEYRLMRSACLIQSSRSTTPQVGDTVIEISRFDPDPSMIGVLDSIENDPDLGVLYHVAAMSGEKQRWVNAEVLTIKVGPPAPVVVPEQADIPEPMKGTP